MIDRTTWTCRYETVVRRWPIIITGVIDRIHRLNHDATMALKDVDPTSQAPNELVVNEKIEEGKGIIGKASKLKYDMARDRAMECVFFWILGKGKAWLRWGV